MEEFRENLYSENDLLRMIDDTTKIVSTHKINELSAAFTSNNSVSLTNEVEFFKWLSRNYEKSGIFNSNESLLQYMSGGSGKYNWLERQIQGKGYEYDWMSVERANPKNAFKIYSAGDNPTRPGSDVTEINILTGNTRELQMKAYTSSAKPNLKNTPKDTTVVTNVEKVATVTERGYDTEPFLNNEQIKKATSERMDKIENNTANTNYTFKNITTTMTKASAIGLVVGITTETIALYSSYKQGNIESEEYLREVLKAGGNASVVSGATAGIMIPISAAITSAGITSVITIPIAFVVGAGLDKFVAPCFGRGKYKELLQDAKYYNNINLIYRDLTACLQTYNQQYSQFIIAINEQNNQYNYIKVQDEQLDKELDLLYDRIRGIYNE